MKRFLQSVILPTLIGIALGILSLFLSVATELSLATVILGAILGTQLTIIRKIFSEDPRTAIDNTRKISSALSVSLEEVLLNTPISLTSISREPEMLEKVTQDFRALQGKLQKVRAGQLEVEPDDNAILIKWIERARFTIDGSAPASYAVDWSSSARGQRFWKAQVGAIQRGVTIRRIYIYDHMTEELRRLVQAQLAAGVICRVLDITRLPGPFIHDMTIVDGCRLHEAYYGVEGRPWRDRYSVAEADLASSNSEFQRLLDLSDEIGLPRGQ